MIKVMRKRIEVVFNGHIKFTTFSCPINDFLEAHKIEIEFYTPYFIKYSYIHTRIIMCRY